jgi:hypothetical protein
MVQRLLALALLSSALISPSGVQARVGQTPASQDHVAWVADALKRMQTIQPGMTREDLLKVFTTEGGLMTRVHRTYVSRDCLFFKVDVQFLAVGAPSPDGGDLVALVEGRQDIIVRISRPYLEFRVSD